jgi:hypothetical protein
MIPCFRRWDTPTWWCALEAPVEPLRPALGKQGVQLERTILELMREALKMENVDPDKIKKVVVDRKGIVFWNDYSSDIDVLVENGNVYAIEVKAKASHADVTRFVQKIKLYELVENKKVKRRG